LPVHQDVEIGGAFLAIGDGLLFADPVETHDRRLVLDPAIGVAVAQFRRAERVECFGVGGAARNASTFFATASSSAEAAKTGTTPSSPMASAGNINPRRSIFIVSSLFLV